MFRIHLYVSNAQRVVLLPSTHNSNPRVRESVSAMDEQNASHDGSGNRIGEFQVMSLMLNV